MPRKSFEENIIDEKEGITKDEFTEKLVAIKEQFIQLI